MSDHGSGPAAQADPSSDICDVYAFPSPERAGHLVLVMDLFPFAGLSAVFFLISLVFVYRSFYGMRIESEN